VVLGRWQSVSSSVSNQWQLAMRSQVVAVSTAMHISIVFKLSEVQQPGTGTVGSIVGLPVTTSVGSGVGGVHSGASTSPSIHEHSSVSMQSLTSSIPPQNDQVRGEFPAQQPTVLKVGAGGAVVVGGSVNSQSVGSSVSIHEHTPADSQSAPFSMTLQNDKVLGEYPVQHPCSE
jgi:hypothetical protein